MDELGTGTGVADWREQYAEQWARTIVTGLRTPFPWAAAHLSSGPDDCDATPWVLHPSFHGCLDWHSSVHMQASALALLDEAGPHLAQVTRDELVQLLDERITTAAVQVESDYLRRHPSYERPYGWAWAMVLVRRARASAHPHAGRWSADLAPLAEVVEQNLLAWLPRLSRPVRTGVHDNTAFALTLLLDAARALGRDQLAETVGNHAQAWYGPDREAPVAWEPGGNDFLSPSLAEAQLMSRVLGERGVDFVRGLLPGLGEANHPLLHLPPVLDRTDGKSVHLFGLGLHRAWAHAELATAIQPERRDAVLAAMRHQVAEVHHEVTAGDFMSTHWLVSFALAAEISLERAR